jgi:ribosomal protein S27E
MVLLDRCPGTANLRTPTLAVKKCLQCRNEVEIFSNEPSATCDRCGLVIWNDSASCIR